MQSLLCLFSEIYRLISEGVSDLHCMSDEYLTEELNVEYKKNLKDITKRCDKSQHLNDAGFYFFKSLLRLLTLLKKK